MLARFPRRNFIKASGGLAISALLPDYLLADINDLSGITMGPFGYESSAEDVTNGLDLSGKTALITGCNSGLGLESMRVLAMRGTHVIGAARTMEKATAACESVDGKTTPVVCELTEKESIVACAETVKALDLPIDMLMLNAGIMALPELEQVDGIEKQFAVNHLGHFLLTHHLLSQVQAAGSGRVIVLSSVGYRNAPATGIEFDNLSGERDYVPFKMYGQSKLANALFSLELSRRQQDTGVTANSVHPGLIRTNLGRYMRMSFAHENDPRLRLKELGPGAATQVYVAAHPNVEGVSGHYFEDCNPVVPEAGKHMDDLDMAARLWEVSEDLCEGYL